jgi:hypothetical protein
MSKKINHKFKLVLFLLLISGALLVLWQVAENNDYCEQNHPGPLGEPSEEYFRRCINE